jgi:hypothetical protein
MRNSNTNNWRSTALIAGAILTAGVVTTISTTNAHADDNQTNAQVSNNQATYQQVQATADQQLAQLQSANDSKEAQQATANEQSNAADLAQTNAQIDQLKASHAALLDEQADAIAQAQAATASSIEEQTEAAQAEYQQQINAQQQNQATQQAANDQKYAQAVSQAAENQSAVANIQAQYQKAVSDAAGNLASQNQTATTNYNDAVAKENAKYEAKVSAQKTTNESNVNNAQVALDNATKDAQQPKTVNVTSQKDVYGKVAQGQANPEIYQAYQQKGFPLEVEGYWNGKTYFIPVSAYTNPVFANTYYGEYPDAAAISSKTEASTPTNINEMPLDFKPGLLNYDAKKDNSEKVTASGLSAQQIQVLRALATSWTNGFRNNVYQNYRAFYNTVNSKNGFKDVAPMTMMSTSIFDDVANQVAASRAKYNVDNNTHSVNGSGLPADQTYSAYLINKLKGFENQITNNNRGTEIYSLRNENLTTMQAENPTLLNYAINLYNSMQGMYYGELVNANDPKQIGGHARNILRGDLRVNGIGFQKLSAEIAGKPGSGISDLTNAYAVTFNNAGFNIGHDANRTKAVQNDAAWGTSSVEAQLNDIKHAQHHKVDVTTQKQVQPSAEEVQQATAGAQQNLANVKAQAQKNLDALASDHQANLAQLQKQYDATKAQLKANYDQAVAAAATARDNALKATGTTDLAAYKAQLDAAYQDLVKADQVAAQKFAADRDAKINNIKATENEKLAAKIAELVPSVEPQIQELQQKHQAVIAHGDEVLAALKAENKAAYAKLEQQFKTQLAQIQEREAAKNQNEVQLGNATVVLPTTNATVTNTVASRPQAAANVTAGRVQTVANPVIVRPATQTTVAAAPVVTTNQAATPASATPAPAVATTSAVAATTAANTNVIATPATPTPAVSANSQATKADNNKKSAPAKKTDTTVAKKQTTKKASQKVDQSSMSIVALAATALLGAVGITYSTKKHHN